MSQRLEVMCEPIEPDKYRIIMTTPDGERYYLLVNIAGIQGLIDNHRKQKPWPLGKLNARKRHVWRVYETALVKCHNFMQHNEGFCDCDNGPF